MCGEGRFGERDPFLWNVTPRVSGQAHRRGRRGVDDGLGRPGDRKGLRSGPCSGHLTDIEHIVLLMQENRSFDHYFGTLSGVNGFSIPSPLFQQKGWNPQTQALDPSGITIPFRFDTTRGPLLDGECVNDPDHAWVAMHHSWNNGANDNWLPAQAGYPHRGIRPDASWVITPARTSRSTTCWPTPSPSATSYHCSLLGGTLPNRLYWMSANIDPDGTQGGPAAGRARLPAAAAVQLAHHAGEPQKMPASAGRSTKTRMPGPHQFADQQQRAGTGLQAVGESEVEPSPLRYRPELSAGLRRRRHGQQAAVGVVGGSDVHPVRNIPHCRWRSAPSAMVTVLRILLSNPAVWEKTALIVSYDENGGFFDHVVPPTAPPGTPGEYDSRCPTSTRCPGPAASAGPIGLGFRVPCLVISPYSRGGLDGP